MATRWQGRHTLLLAWVLLQEPCSHSLALALPRHPESFCCSLLELSLHFISLYLFLCSHGYGTMQVSPKTCCMSMRDL